MPTYRIRVLAAVTLLIVAGWGLVSYAIEHGPPWLGQVFLVFAVAWLSTLAVASLWFAIGPGRRARRTAD